MRLNTMKLAILSDFHLGYERFREDAYIQAKEALDAAAREADVLVMPGDIFDMRNPKPEVLAEAINIFRDLSDRKWNAKVTRFDGSGKNFTELPIIAIPGTHERRAYGVEDPVDLLALAGLLVDISDGRVFVEKNGEHICIFGLGGIAEERFKEALKNADLHPEPGMFNVFIFHQSVHELLPFSSDFITLDDLPVGFDLYIDGHIHNKVEMKAHGKPFLIPGSTVLTQLKEGEQEAKGFFIFDTATKEYLFKEIRSRRFKLVKIEVDGLEPEKIAERIERGISSEIAKESEDKPIIRVELAGRLMDGFKGIDIDVQSAIKEFKDKAIIEIGKGKVESEQKDVDIASLRSGTLENLSIKDFGLSVFVEKLAEKKYELEANPRELFDLLAEESNKEKAVKSALDLLLYKKERA
jgi:DNA repair exonuclease SbcCD nuclease subunit